MKFSKKSLLSLIQENLNEMPMDFDTQDRPHNDIQSKLAQNDTPLTKVPLPKTGEEPNKNFQELLASERYKQVLEKLRQYTGHNVPLTGENNITPLIQQMMLAHNDIVRTEYEHREELEKLAIDLVVNELSIPEGSFQFDVKIVGLGEIDVDNFNREDQNGENQNGENQNQPEVDLGLDVEIDLMNNLEQLNLEKAKRRLINSIIQGASKRGHYMYHMVSEKLRELTGSDRLLNNYGILMSINDSLYWQMGDENMKSLMGQGGVGGKEEVDRNTDPPTIRVRAINFPICIHEIIKGILEVFAIQGQPEDQDLFQKVMESEDTLEKEVWDLRLGPVIWDRIREQYPEEIFTDESKRELQNWLLVEIFKLPAKNFLVLLKEVISGSDSGKQLLNEIFQGIESLLQNEEYQTAMEQFDNDLNDITENTNDDDLGDFLRDLGIDLSDDDDE